MSDPALPGVITDPHTAYVAWSFAVAGVSLALLAAHGFWQARRWARRAQAALEAEATSNAKKASAP